MKKSIIAGLLLSFIISLTACNNNGTSIAEQPSTEAATTIPVTAVAPTTVVPTTVVPTTIPPTTIPAAKEYTAEELSEKTIPEIIDIMGGEFNFDKSKGLIWYSGGGFYIYNDDRLPGFVFYIDEAQSDYQSLKDTEGEEKADKQIRENLINGKYKTISFIALYGSAKLNDSISADMNYQQFISAYGYAPTGAIPPSERVGHILRYDKERIKTVQVYYNYSGTRRNSREKESDEEMNQINPDVFAITAIPRELAIPEYQDPEETQSGGYEKYLGSWGNTGEVGRGYTVVISSVNGNQIECSMSMVGSVGHMATVSPISMTIEDNVAYFDYTDSWTNKGSGSITFDADTIIIEANITERNAKGYSFMAPYPMELTKINDSTDDPFM